MVSPFLIILKENEYNKKSLLKLLKYYKNCSIIINEGGDKNELVTKIVR